MPNRQLPTLSLEERDVPTIRVGGRWQVHALVRAGVSQGVGTSLQDAAKHADAAWDLSDIVALDHIGAQWLWNTWGKKRPTRLRMPAHYEAIFQRLERGNALILPKKPPQPHWYSPATLMRLASGFAEHLVGFIALLGQLVIDLGRFLANPLRGPWKEISANIFHIGYQALGITALVGFLIGVVLSYLSAQQLHTFGGDVYLVNILGMSIIRELGPLLAAILVAGRSGSAITAQIGVMRVTEELDAMLVMGMPHGFRLIMPKVIALAISMPLLVVWTDVVALAGGIFAAQMQLSLSATYFLRELPDAVPLANYWIGIGKGFTFGCLIAMIACHFGLRIEPDTESLGAGTTLSVVSAITVVILADAVFAILFKNVGF